MTTLSFPATVTEVIDGDTLKLSVDLGSARKHTADYGFHVYAETGRLTLHYSFRLLGLNCAEHGTPGGDAATAFVKSLLPVGAAVHVASVSSDKYDRYDAIVSLADGRVLNTLLVASGYAAAWNGEGPKPVPPWPIPVAPST